MTPQLKQALGRIRRVLDAAKGQYVEVLAADVLEACASAGDCPAAAQLRAACQGLVPTRDRPGSRPAERVYVTAGRARELLALAEPLPRFVEVEPRLWVEQEPGNG